MVMAISKTSNLHERRAGRNLAVALCLVGFMVLLVTLSLVKLRGTGPTEGFDHVRRPALEATE